jgi:NADPH:quinone reductase-like Zn-dependent oxidoreductase
MLVYGAGSTVGQYVIQLLQLAGYTNVIATASAKHHAYLRSLGATHTFDYNSPSLVEDVTKAAGGKVTVAIDCVSVKESLAILGKIVSAPGKVAFLLPIKEGSTITGNVEEKLYMNLPDDINPFPKDIKVFEIKTFLYQQVCLSSFFTHPDGADVSPCQ